MEALTLIDSGPLVALLDRTEREHERVRSLLRHQPAPFHTTEAVLSETCFLLRDIHQGPQTVMRMVRDQLLLIDFHVAQNATALLSLMEKYADVPMSLADACLVRMAEMNRRAKVLTLDSDFKIYRIHKNQPIPLIETKSMQQQTKRSRQQR